MNKFEQAAQENTTLIPNAGDQYWVFRWVEDQKALAKKLESLRACLVGLLKAHDPKYTINVKFEDLSNGMVGYTRDVGTSKKEKQVVLNLQLFMMVPETCIVSVFSAVALHEYFHVLHSIRNKWIDRILSLGASDARWMLYQWVEDTKIEYIGKSTNEACREQFSLVYENITLGGLKSLRGPYKGAADRVLSIMLIWVRYPQELTVADREWEPEPGYNLYEEMQKAVPNYNPCEEEFSTQAVVEALYKIFQKFLEKQDEEPGEGSDSSENSNETGDESGETSSGEESSEESEKNSDSGEATSEATSEDTSEGQGEDSSKQDSTQGGKSSNVSSGGEPKTTATNDDSENKESADKEDNKTGEEGTEQSKEQPKKQSIEQPKVGKEKLTKSDIETIAESLSKQFRLGDSKLTPEERKAIKQQVQVLAQLESNPLHEWEGVSTLEHWSLNELSGSAQAPEKIIWNKAPKATTDDLIRYKTELNSVKQGIAAVRQKFMIRHSERVVWEHEKVRGRLDQRRLARAVHDNHIFRTSEITKSQGLDIAILIDGSGSMWSGNKMTQARKCGILLASALQGVQDVNLYVYSHTTGTGSKCTEGGYDYSSRNCVVTSLYGDLASKDVQNLATLEANANNYDGFALAYVSDRLHLVGTPTNEKWLIYIADGLPNGDRSSYYGQDACSHTRKVIKEIGRGGVHVIGVDIEGLPEFKEMCPNSFKFTDVKKLCSNMGRLVGSLVRNRSIEVSV